MIVKREKFGKCCSKQQQVNLSPGSLIKTTIHTFVHGHLELQWRQAELFCHFSDCFCTLVLITIGLTTLILSRCTEVGLTTCRFQIRVVPFSTRVWIPSVHATFLSAVMVKTKYRMKGISACRVILDNCIQQDIVTSWKSIQVSLINVIFNKMIVNRIAITLQWGEKKIWNTPDVIYAAILSELPTFCSRFVSRNKKITQLWNIPVAL